MIPEGDSLKGQSDCPGKPISETDKLMLVVYEELRSIAAHHLQKERSDHTLQPTALVHEVYLRLSESASLQWTDQSHFLAIAARCVRQILVNHARSKHALKRGGDALKLTLIEGAIPILDAQNHNIDVLELEEALKKLGVLDERQMRVVELRYFGGLTVQEVARVLEVSPRTVEGDWAVARAWLSQQLYPAE